MSVRYRGKTKKGEGWTIDLHLTAAERYYEVFYGTEAEAREYEANLRKELVKPKIVSSQTIADLTQDYLEYVRNHSKSANGKTYRDKKKMLYGHLLAHFGNMRVDGISSKWIERYITKRKSEVGARGQGNRAINLELLCLSALVKWATKEGLKFTRLPDKARIPVILSREETRALLAAMPPQYRARALCLYNAGMRKQEVIDLTWDRVDFQNGVIVIIGKGGYERVTPMSVALYAALWSMAVARKHPSLVFVSRLTRGKLTDLKRPLQTAAKKAGITKRVYPHLMRHCCGAHGLETDGDLRSMQVFLGHRQISTTLIYTQINANQKKRILEGLES